jgi:hypothetical protein
MRTAKDLAVAYSESPFCNARTDYLRELRGALTWIEPASYRGIGRYPLNASYDHQDPGWQWEKAKPRLAEGLGRLAVEEILGDWRVTGEEWLIDGPWLLPDMAAANHVRTFLEQPDGYELVEVARYPAQTHATPLGFDVGYWASGNFSIICDVAVWPLWHPPPTEALPGLARLLNALNERVLFSDAAAAMNFREAYRSAPWAEDEEGTPFEIIQIAKPDLGI